MNLSESYAAQVFNDTLEILQQENKQLRAELATAYDTIEAIKKESMLRGEANTELRAELSDMRLQVHDLIAALEGAKAERDALLAAAQCVIVNLNKGMSKSLQKHQARGFVAAIMIAKSGEL